VRVKVTGAVLERVVKSARQRRENDIPEQQAENAIEEAVFDVVTVAPGFAVVVVVGNRGFHRFVEIEFELDNLRAMRGAQLRSGRWGFVTVALAKSQRKLAGELQFLFVEWLRNDLLAQLDSLHWTITLCRYACAALAARW